jgi:hypothetical protein
VPLIANILISLRFRARHKKANCNEINDFTFKSDRLLAKEANGGELFQSGPLPHGGGGWR